MTKRSDWMPTTRNAKLAMAEAWGEFVSEKAELWNIPLTVITLFAKVTLTAKNLIAIPESSRDAVTNAHLKKAFDELEDMMRDIKKRYFYNPPLIDADFVALGLKPKDTIPTPIGVPVGLVTATFKYPNEAALELHIKHVEGTPFDGRANYGVKIRYAVFDLNAEMPTSVKQLQDSRFSRKKKELFTFDRAERQKTVCFCMRYENSKGDAGQWGAIVSAIIP